jgi:hypothetical protein
MTTVCTLTQVAVKMAPKIKIWHDSALVQITVDHCLHLWYRPNLYNLYLPVQYPENPSGPGMACI